MYEIMAGDKRVVNFDETTFDYEIVDPQRAPIYIKNRGNIKRWIEERAVDSTRSNSRAVKSRQGLSKNATDYDTAMRVDAATITDNYWVKAEHDDRTWESVQFRKNDFFGLSLYRDFEGLSLGPSRTPELTNIGAREKGWKLENGVWWLYKNEPIQEVVSEYLTFRIGQLMGYSMASYELVAEGRFIKTKDFTAGKWNLQHIDGVMMDHMQEGREIPDDDYQYNYQTLQAIDPMLAEQYLQICTLDALCENYDRHTKNYGLLTDRETGRIVSLAPNYDNNNSLFANYGLKKERKGGVLKQFLDFVEKEELVLELPEIPDEQWKELIADVCVQTPFSFDEAFLFEFLTNGIKRLQSV